MFCYKCGLIHGDYACKRTAEPSRTIKPLQVNCSMCGGRGNIFIKNLDPFIRYNDPVTMRCPSCGGKKVFEF